MERSTKRQRRDSPQKSTEAADAPRSILRQSARIQKSQEAQPKASLREESSLATVSTPDILDAGAWEALKAQAQEILSKYSPSKGSTDAKLITTYQALLEFLPEGGREAIARDVVKAQGSDQLFDAFKNVVTCLLTPMRAAGGKTPTMSSPFSENQEGELTERAKLTKPQVRSQQFIDGCFARDDKKCVASQFLDEEEWEKRGEPSDAVYGRLEAAHIIPFSFGMFEKSTASRDRASSMWAMIHRCFPSTHQTLRSTTIDNLENGILLHKTIHDDFGRFQCAFRPTDTPNTYVFVHYKRFSIEMKPFAPDGVEITFKKAPGCEDLPLPCREYIDCHYRLAEVFHASGMGEEIDRHLRRWEEMKQEADEFYLAEDGSSDIDFILRVAFWDVHC
ncbi:hypothetical protein ASPZODRAFT_104994 [Penicilliopsis zonata CBS 506.65]|uniref:HNH nuclease domain-containing protein n=1 Tax=Penicilliopsis zonata CBS 506.65 TaxID=1073090 RepID=A0A1L9S5Z1_9EURO|nr:hypothetical protein ASPZODRAFT_104994 [Penicilliopsis zonata CBS 506.65]OJJ42581.1 hypothetical protein ASPZODRAFT_104994 [Penicilliopsis zonata CBS 506.65]